MRNLSSLSFAITLSILFVCCKKENLGAPSAETHLVQIEGDSIGRWSYSYSNNKISDLYVHNLYAPDSIHHYVTFSYPADKKIKVSYFGHPGIYAEYTLNESELPLHIVRSEFNSTIDFFYNAQTHLLDSAVDNYDYETYLEHDQYAFEYENSNIVKLIRTRYYSNRNISEIDTFSFTYDESPNAFQKADPLLFIYSNPFADIQETYNMIIYFPQIFSMNTLTSYTFPSNAVLSSGEPRTIFINNTTTTDGKILTTQGFVINRQYFYQ